MAIWDEFKGEATSLEVSSAASTDPITVAEAKTHMRVDTSDDDTYIGNLISAATSYIQDRTCRQMINATFKLRLDKFEAIQIWLPRAPLSSVTSIQYVDENEATQTLSASKYKVDSQSLPGRIKQTDGESWPQVSDNLQSVIITFVAGYGSATTDIPEGLRLAVRILTAHWYESREPIVTGTIVAQVPLSVESLINQFKVHNYR